MAFVGWSGSGKTTLLAALVPVLRSRGLEVGYLKSAHHGFEMDREGKDTDRLFRSGAGRVGVATRTEGALRFRLEEREARLLLDEHFRGCDVVLVEGFRESDLPKIEVVSGEPVVPAGDARLLALVSAGPDPRPVPRFDPGDTAGLATFVVDRVVGRMGGPS